MSSSSGESVVFGFIGPPRFISRLKRNSDDRELPVEPFSRKQKTKNKKIAGRFFFFCSGFEQIVPWASNKQEESCYVRAALLKNSAFYLYFGLSLVSRSSWG